MGLSGEQPEDDCEFVADGEGIPVVSGIDSNEMVRRTKSLAVRVFRVVNSLPKSIAGRTVAGQLIRSASSTAANYRASRRARSRREFAAKLQIAFEEADETGFWLELIVDTGMLPAQRLEALRKEADEIVAILVTTLKTVRSNMGERLR